MSYRLRNRVAAATRASSACPAGYYSGTLAYMAPEPSGFHEPFVDHASIFYSRAVIFIEMLTVTALTLPTPRVGPLHIARRPTLLRMRCIPSQLCALVMKLLAKNSEDRYRTALGVGADLQTVLREWEQEGH